MKRKKRAMPGGMEVSSGGISTVDLCAKKPTPLLVPIREVGGDEGLVMGLRQEMLLIGDGQGSVCTGAGLGSDFIILNWGDRQAAFRGSELLKAWVATFDPKSAAKFPEEILSVVAEEKV